MIYSTTQQITTKPLSQIYSTTYNAEIKSMIDLHNDEQVKDQEYFGNNEIRNQMFYFLFHVKENSFMNAKFL